RVSCGYPWPGLGGTTGTLTPMCCDDSLSRRTSCFRLGEVWQIGIRARSFDVIVGMDWFSKRKFVIVCHEKVVRISLEGDEILRVHGERTQGVVKTLMNAKDEIRGSQLIRPELVQETANKVVLIKERLKASGDHQKSYADNKLKSLELKLVIKGY
nr:putative reverse transcriptase domain-containing protein [Tanacetum cinerariifolium]